MENEQTKDSVTLAVSEFSSERDAIIFQDISLSETVGNLKLKVFKEMAQRKGFQDFRRLGDPESMLFEVLKLKHGRVVPKRSLSLDDTQSLREFISNAGYPPSYSPHIRLHIAPEWIRYLDIIGPRPMPADVDVNCLEYPEYDSDYEDYICPDVDSKINTQRPLVLPENMNVFQVIGKLQVNNKLPQVGYLGGLRCDLKDVDTFTTPAKHVVLVFSDFNMNMFEDYYLFLDTPDAANNPNEMILCLLVTWDKFSYLFLRKLRNSIGVQVPIIAFTDCSINQIDLLTFLDTPPKHVAQLYGWDDLYEDCANLGIGLDDVVDIKWGGLRPSELPLLSLDRSSVGRVEDEGISATYDNLFLRSKDKWPKEVQVFEKIRYNTPLMCIDYKLSPSTQDIWIEYIRKKFGNEDWI